MWPWVHTVCVMKLAKTNMLSLISNIENLTYVCKLNACQAQLERTL